DRTAARDTIHARAARVARIAELVHLLLELRHQSRVRRKERIFIHRVPRLERNRRASDLRETTAHLYAVALAEPFLRDGACRDANHGLARRRATAAARIANAVLLQIGVIGMPRPELLRDRRVVLGRWSSLRTRKPIAV